MGESRGGVGKSGVLENKSGNISETRKDRENVYYGRPIGTHRMVTIPDPLLPPLPFPKIGGSQRPLKTAIENRGKKAHSQIVCMLDIYRVGQKNWTIFESL